MLEVVNIKKADRKVMGLNRFNPFHAAVYVTLIYDGSESVFLIEYTNLRRVVSLEIGEEISLKDLKRKKHSIILKGV